MKKIKQITFQFDLKNWKLIPKFFKWNSFFCGSGIENFSLRILFLEIIFELYSNEN